MRGKNDFADRIMEKIYAKHPKSKVVEPYYLKYKELMLYGLFGLGTFLIAVLGYAFLTEILLWNILFANAFAWIFATLFAFFTNRRWVFASHAKGIKAFFLQLGSFTFGRTITLAIEEWMLYFFVGVLEWPNMTVKFCSQFIVIALNYVVSKLIVFRKRH